MKDLENRKYFTRDGEEIPKENIMELDEEGYVMTSVRTIIFNFNKKEDEIL